MTLGRPVTCLASFTADSVASAPELAKKKVSTGGGRDGGQPPGQLGQAGVAVDVDLGVDEPGRLGLDGLHHVRVAVAGARDRDAAREVEVLLAVGGGDDAARAGGHLEVGDPEPHVRHAVSHRRPPLPRYPSQPSDGPPLPSGPCSTSAASAPNPTPCAPGSPGAAATRRPTSIASSSSTCSSGPSAPSATTCGPGSRCSRRRSASCGARATPTAAEALMAESRALGDQERALDAEVERISAEVRDLLLRTPNVPVARLPRRRRRGRQRRAAHRGLRPRRLRRRTSACPTGTSAPSSGSSTASGPPRSPARCSRCTAAGAPACCAPWCSSASTATPMPTRRSGRPPSCAPTR